MTVEEFARREAGGVLDEAFALARRQAVEDVAKRLRPALVEAALAHTAGPAPELTHDPDPEPTAAALPAPAPEPTDAPELTAAFEPISAPEAAPTAEPGATGLYAYAITRAGELDLAAAEGVTNGRPRLLTHAGLGLVVSEIRLSELDGLTADEPEEGGRLATLARQHDEVIRFVAEQAPVLPLRFGTVLADVAGVRTLLMERHDSALALLDRIDGSSEWGVKVLVGPARSTTAPAPTRSDTDADTTSGTEYLARRRAALAEVDDRRHRDDEALDAMHAALAVHSVDSLRRRAPVPELPLDVAYLVPDGRATVFTAEAAALTTSLAEQGLHLQLTGPWPPYTFVRAAFEDVAHG